MARLLPQQTLLFALLMLISVFLSEVQAQSSQVLFGTTQNNETITFQCDSVLQLVIEEMGESYLESLNLINLGYNNCHDKDTWERNVNRLLSQLLGRAAITCPEDTVAGFGHDDRDNLGDQDKVPEPTTCYNTIQLYKRVIGPNKEVLGEYFQREYDEITTNCPGRVKKDYVDFHECCIEDSSDTEELTEPNPKTEIVPERWVVTTRVKGEAVVDQLTALRLSITGTARNTIDTLNIFKKEYGLVVGGELGAWLDYAPNDADMAFMWSRLAGTNWHRGYWGTSLHIGGLIGLQTERAFIEISPGVFAQIFTFEKSSPDISPGDRFVVDRAAHLYLDGRIGLKSKNGQNRFGLSGGVQGDVSNFTRTAANPDGGDRFTRGGWKAGVFWEF